MEFWKNLKKVENIESILGMDEEYESVNGLLQLRHPSITKALY